MASSNYISSSAIIKLVSLDEGSEDRDREDPWDLFLLLLKEVVFSSSKPSEGRSSITTGDGARGIVAQIAARMTTGLGQSPNLKKVLNYDQCGEGNCLSSAKVVDPCDFIKSQRRSLASTQKPLASRKRGKKKRKKKHARAEVLKALR
ncbi:unnamed protein product [Ilex paraguariensis]|uniref:Uncharacterized protein n=1 Tax=Ilex paraguariensis TaxID=185542 RepID=A0ABC8U258_9AQUA